MRFIAGLFFCTAIVATAQPADRPAFEVASIKPGEPGKQVIEQAPGSVSMRHVRLNAVIRWAYDVQDFQISGPPWLNDVWFEVWAKAATPAKEAELRRMLQTLLEDRFKLAVHRQSKEISALILTVGKNGHKMQAVETEGSPSFKTGKMNLTGQGATVGQMTDFLTIQLGFPIIDQTGLTGRFNYFLDIGSYVTEEMRKGDGNGGPPPDAPSIVAQAIQAQLGLKLDSKKAPVEMLVIDRVEKTPTEN